MSVKLEGLTTGIDTLEFVKSDVQLNAFDVLGESYHIGSVPTRLWARYTGPTSLSDLMTQRPHWTRRGLLYQGAEHQREVLDTVKDLRKMSVPEPYNTSEEDSFEKFTLQGMKPPPFWFVDKFHANREVDTEAIGLGCSLAFDLAITSFSATKAAPKLATISDPLDTNKGAPLHSSDLAEFLVLIDELDECFNPSRGEATVKLLGDIRLPRSTHTTLSTIFSRRDEDVRTLACSRIGRRDGPTTKRTTLYERLGNSVVSRGTIAPYQRVRHVYMVPYLVNLALSPVHADYVSLFSTLPELDQSDEGSSWFRQMLRTTSNPEIFEADISGMDRTYPEVLSTTISNLMIGLRADGYSDVPLSFLRGLHRMGILLPDFLSIDGSDAGLLLTPRSSVGRYSGVKLTTAYNSIGHLALLCYGLFREGLISKDDPGRYRSKFGVRIQGDDIIIKPTDEASSSEISSLLSNLESYYDAFGFEAEAFPGNTFLMRHYDENGDDHPVMARVLQNTLSPEHAPTSAPVMRIGMAARSMGMMTVPAELKDARDAVLAALELYSPAMARIAQSSDDDKQDLIANETTKLSDSEKGVSQLLDLLIKARFSLTGREILDKIVGTDIERMIAAQEAEARAVFERAIISSGLPDPLNVMDAI